MKLIVCERELISMINMNIYGNFGDKIEIERGHLIDSQSKILDNKMTMDLLK